MRISISSILIQWVDTTNLAGTSTSHDLREFPQVVRCHRRSLLGRGERSQSHEYHCPCQNTGLSERVSGPRPSSNPRTTALVQSSDTRGSLPDFLFKDGSIPLFEDLPLYEPVRTSQKILHGDILRTGEWAIFLKIARFAKAHRPLQPVYLLFRLTRTISQRRSSLL